MSRNMYTPTQMLHAQEAGVPIEMIAAMTGLKKASAQMVITQEQKRRIRAANAVQANDDAIILLGYVRDKILIGWNHMDLLEFMDPRIDIIRNLRYGRLERRLEK